MWLERASRVSGSIRALAERNGTHAEAAIETLHVLGIRSKTQVTEKVIAKSRRPLAIGAFCIGVNQIDLDAARSKGMPVFNAPYSSTRSVAEPG